jgi:hypothetical protein
MSKVVRQSARNARLPIISPNEINGLKLWLLAGVGAFSDAGSTPAVNNDAVRQWNDQSGLSKTFSQSILGSRPTYKTSILNSKSVIRFDGVDDRIDSVYFSVLPQPNTVFLVWNFISPVYCYPMDGPIDNGPDRVYLSHNEQAVGNLGLNSGAGGYPGYPLSLPSGFIISTFVLNGSTSVMKENGVVKFSGAGGSNGFRQIRLGSHNNEALNAEMDVAEFIIYNSLLTDSEILSVERYLNSRYSIY